MIYSFDIFDTCLTRQVAEPADVFDIIAKRHGLGRFFRFHRQEAEREAVRRFGQVTLTEIHQILSEWMGHDEGRRDELIAAELEEEGRQLIPIPEMLALIARCRLVGGQIIFISDMYLPSSFLRKRLHEYGFYRDGDILLVSGEHKKSKVSGALFREACDNLGIKSWKHFGNDLQADVKAARKAGLDGIYCPWGNLTRHESTLISWDQGGDNFAREWAGCSRSARLASGPLNESEKVIATVSAGVAGPTILLYASWLVEEAAKRKIENLYFLARDGQVFMEAFDLIAKKKGLSVRSKYLHGSRIALRFPRKFPLSDEDASGVFQGSGNLHLSVVAARLGITDGLLRSWIPSGYVSCDRIKRQSISQIRLILGSNEIASELQRIADNRKSLLIAYLRQSGFLDENRPTVVDLGWNGTLQVGLQKSLNEAGLHHRIHGLYMGLNSTPKMDFSAAAYLCDTRMNGTKFDHWICTVTETLCQANHGTTLGFVEAENDLIIPLLDEPDGQNPLVPNWLDLHRNTINSFIKAAIERQAVPNSALAYRRLVSQLLHGLWINPTRDEARIWGACQFSNHGLAKTKSSLAPYPKSFRDLTWALGICSFGVGRSLWQQGTAEKLPFPITFAAKGVHRIRKRLCS